MKERKSDFQRIAAQWMACLLIVPSFFVLGMPQIAEHMKALNQDFRELRRQLADPEKKPANLALIGQMKKHVLRAREEQPTKILSQPESEHSALLESYRDLLNKVVLNLEKLEKAIEANRTEESAALVKELNELKKEGHSKFQE